MTLIRYNKLRDFKIKLPARLSTTCRISNQAVTFPETKKNWKKTKTKKNEKEEEEEEEEEVEEEKKEAKNRKNKRKEKK